MASKKQRLISDCSNLPYSRARAGLILAPSPKAEAIPALDFDNITTLKIRELTGQPILKWPIQIPDVDPRGVPLGPDFKCWKEARDGKTGVSANWYSIKSGRYQPCHSHLESKLRAYFEMSPFVVACRTQYPSWDKDEYQRYSSSNMSFPTNKVMTIDFMLTLSIPGIPFFLHHGVSGKPRGQIDLKPTKARHEREVDSLWKWGGTHEVCDEFTIQECEYSNYILLRSWLLWTDIEARMGDAELLAQALKKTKAQGSLDRILSMVGKRFGHSLNVTYRIFSVAVFLGHLRLNHRYALRPTMPLYILQ